MIHVTDNIYLDADAYCFMLVEQTTVQNGKTKGKNNLSPYAYFATHRQVVDYLLNQLAKGEITAINPDVIERQRRIEDSMESFDRILTVKKKKNG
jgi:hypothetical protein